MTPPRRTPRAIEGERRGAEATSQFYLYGLRGAVAGLEGACSLSCRSRGDIFTIVCGDAARLVAPAANIGDVCAIS